MNKRSEYERIFNHFDEDGDGKISPFELQSRVGLIHGAGGEPLLEEAQQLVESLDSDEDGLLSLDEFVGLMENIDDQNEEEKLKDVREAFGLYNELDGKDECISPSSLKRMLSRLGESRSCDECALMISHFDLDGDGVLSFDEFKVMMLA